MVEGEVGLVGLEDLHVLEEGQVALGGREGLFALAFVVGVGAGQGVAELEGEGCGGGCVLFY